MHGLLYVYLYLTELYKKKIITYLIKIGFFK